MFQSTPARGGRRVHRPTVAPRVVVSIHARAGRATRAPTSGYTSPKAFQSTPARGGRRYPLRHAQGKALVSIHARAGRATPHSAQPRPPQAVSIHARAGRATRACGACSGRWQFQSTPARGGRRCIFADPGRAPTFQSTPARGGRPRTRPRCPPVARRFNPRPRGAGDATTFTDFRDAMMFQSTPARGGRPGRLPHLPYVGPVSIHARAGRATRVRYDPGMISEVSIHARAGRAT